VAKFSVIYPRARKIPPDFNCGAILFLVFRAESALIFNSRIRKGFLKKSQAPFRKEDKMSSSELTSDRMMIGMEGFTDLKKFKRFIPEASGPLPRSTRSISWWKKISVAL